MKPNPAIDNRVRNGNIKIGLVWSCETEIEIVDFLWAMMGDMQTLIFLTDIFFQFVLSESIQFILR